MNLNRRANEALNQLLLFGIGECSIRHDMNKYKYDFMFRWLVGNTGECGFVASDEMLDKMIEILELRNAQMESDLEEMRTLGRYIPL